MASTKSAPSAGGARQPATMVEVDHRRKLFLVAALSVTLMVTAMSQTVVSTAAQNIVSDIGGFEIFPWMFAGFSLASAVAVPSIGKIADMYGTRPIIIIGLLIFILSSLLAGFVQSMEQMVVVRMFQGLGFSGVLGSVWITTAAMWEPKDRARWLGVLSASFTIAGVAGPVVGGVVSDQIGWRWIFWVNVPIGLAALFLLLMWFPRLRREARPRQFDLRGAFLFSVFSATVLLALSLGGNTYEWSSPQILAMFGIAAAGLLGFVAVERRAPDPMVPLHLFRSRVFSGAMTASLTITVTFVVTTIFVPLLVIGAMGESATVSAIPLITQALGIAIGANLAGQVLSRWGFARSLSATGMGITALMMFWVGAVAESISLGLLSFLTFAMGVGISLAFTSFTVPVQNAMPRPVLGVVTTSLQFSRVFGMALGSTVLGAIMLAQLTIPNTAGTGPEAQIRDPEVVVNNERLAEVRAEFLASPGLGEDAFLTGLDSSRANIARALGMVFTIAGFVSAAGVVLAFATFTGMRPAKEDEDG